MYSLLDHDDFAKSRKALLATCASLLLVGHLQIVGESLTILGLTFKLDRTVLIGFGSIFLIYFTYAFVVRSTELYFSRRIGAVQRRLAELVNEIRNVDTVAIHLVEEMLQKINETVVSLEDTTSYLQVRVLIGLEIAPPLLLAAYTAYNVSAIESSIRFFRL